MSELAIVTGTSRGIGKAVATSLLRQGFFVLGISRGESDIRSPDYAHAVLDLTSFSDVVNWFENDFDRVLPNSVAIDRAVLINNGGSIGPIQRFWEHSPMELQNEFTLNAVVPIWLMGFMVRKYPQCPLSVVNLSSGAAQYPYAGWTTYCSTKASLLMASRVFAQEAEQLTAEGQGPWRSITCFAPGSVDTSMQSRIRQSNPAVFPKIGKFIELQRNQKLFSAEEVAECIASLCSRTQKHHLLNLRYLGHSQARCLECGQVVFIDATSHKCLDVT
jgi:benzil reductase ((S)-benzoin forming)